MAGQIIDSLATGWEPSRHHETYTERVTDYIEQKAKGGTLTPAEPEEKPEKVVDIMAALEASLAASKKERKPAPAKRRNSA